MTALAAPAAPSFGQLLMRFRLRSGRSGSAIAWGAAIDASYLSRMERGEREPPRKDVVESLCRELGLGPDEADQLRAAAGLPPAAVEALGALDPTLVLVAGILADAAIPPAQREEFRQLIDLAARRWRPAA